MTTSSVFSLIDQDGAAYVAGLWQGYAEVFSTQAKAVAGAVGPLGSSFKGRRATLFDSWWKPVDTDLTTVGHVMQMMSDAFHTFVGKVPAINDLFQKASTLLVSNCKLLHDTTWGYDQGKTSGSGAPEGFQIVISGPTATKMGGQYASTPAWYTQMQSCLTQAHTDYVAATTALGQAIEPAAGLLKGLRQLKEIDKTGGAIGSEGPFKSLGDPTWKLLTGGGVFRPDTATGFHGDPFSRTGIPKWYQPSTFTKVLDFVGDHLGDIVNGASLLVALAGFPEVAATIETAGGVVGTVKDAADGDYVGVALDAIGLLVDVNFKSEAVKEFLSNYNIGDKFGSAVAKTLEETEEDITPQVATHFGELVQDHVTDYIKDQVEHGDAKDGKVTVPASVLNQILAQSAQQAGLSTVQAAAG